LGNRQWPPEDAASFTRKHSFVKFVFLIH